MVGEWRVGGGEVGNSVIGNLEIGNLKIGNQVIGVCLDVPAARLLHYVLNEFLFSIVLRLAHSTINY